MAAGGMGPRAFTASCSFALVSFARASGRARALDRAAGCPWGAPWGRGARVKVRRVWCVGGVVPMAAGGMGPRAFTASCSFALVSFARASGGAGASDRAAGCPWGVPWGRGARVEVRQVWFVGGVVPMAAGGMGPRALTASCPFALVSFARASGRARASDRAAGCPWGVPWGRGARVEVRQAESAKMKTSLIVYRKKIFSQKRNFEKCCFHVLKDPSECAFPVSDQESI